MGASVANFIRDVHDGMYIAMPRRLYDMIYTAFYESLMHPETEILRINVGERPTELEDHIRRYELEGVTIDPNLDKDNCLTRYTVVLDMKQVFNNLNIFYGANPIVLEAECDARDRALLRERRRKARLAGVSTAVSYTFRNSKYAILKRKITQKYENTEN